jgi:hypothetical protein
MLQLLPDLGNKGSSELWIFPVWSPELLGAARPLD